MSKTEDSPRRRYLSKLSVGLLQFVLSFVSAPIVNRALGPEGLGIFSFARSSIKEIFSLLGGGTEAAFFNYAVRHKNSSIVILTYSLFIFLVASVMSLFIIGTCLSDTNSFIWPNLAIKYIILGAFISFAGWINSIAASYADAKAETVTLSRVQHLFAILYVLMILLLYMTQSLNLFSYFVLMIIMPVSSTLVLMFLFFRSKRKKREIISKARIRFIIRYFYRYSHPLFTASCFTFIFAFFDRWFLQLVSGSIQQGYFSLGIKISGVVLIFTAAITPIFKREISKAHEEKKIDSIRYLFSKYSRFCFFFVCASSTFLAFHVDILIDILGGSDFKLALIPTALLMIDPLYRTYDQLSGSVFLATERTVAYRNILFLQVLSIPLSYILMAPKNFIIPGFELGATGLALKAVLLAVLMTNFQLFINCKFLKIKFWKVLIHQIGLIILFGSVLTALRMGIKIDMFSIQIINSIFLTIIDGIIFMTLCFSVLFFFPFVGGIDRKDIDLFYKKIAGFLKFR
jgi:O-antigen/teichoic acid export membrane protein